MQHVAAVAAAAVERGEIALQKLGSVKYYRSTKTAATVTAAVAADLFHWSSQAFQRIKPCRMINDDR
ncbi:hypothetical protein M0802_009334 [Mischocyttarus mexicanus]|nr:hypothetical protein M0802_009334 [Mischocyttarus mexicanus]